MVLEVKCPSCGAAVETYRNPFPTVDVIVFRGGKVLLIARRNPPEGWAIPGGFVDYGESAETAAARELREETGLTVTSLRLLGVYSEPGRDPRFHTLSVVYLGEAVGEPGAGDDAAAARWFSREELPALIAFDHRAIIEAAFAEVRNGADGAGA
ncbi:NUDIX hydrolase [candidate division KSB1 bacterium]|nr:NUDIX hydrolase [candidate division KSB1 bacterium]